MRVIAGRLLAEPAPLPWFVDRPWSRWLIVGLVCIGAFVGQLDATIVQLALPALGRAFDVPLQQVSWIALAYLLAFASFLPIFGRLCEMLGRKTLYIAGYALFIVASALCGLAESFDQLLASRVLQGIGGSLLGANSISILVAAVPAAQRGRALGYFAAAQAIGMSAGPAAGGLLLSTLGWRWIFWITVPFGVVAIVLGWLALPRTAGTDRGSSFDWGGALLIGPALILTLATLNHVTDAGWLSGLAMVGLAALLFGVLARRERVTAAPLVHPELFAIPAFGFGAVAVALSYALLYGIFFLMSFALEHGYGESPAEAGLRMALVPVALGLAAPFSSGFSQRLGTSRLGILAMLCCLTAIVALVATTTGIAHHRLYHTLAFLLFGLGLGLFIAPNNAATLAAAPARLAGPAASMLNLVRSLGTSFGVAVGAATLSWRLGADAVAGDDWLTASAGTLLAAVRASLPVLAFLSIVAGAAALAATRRGGPED